MSTKKPNDERKNRCDKKTDSLRKELNKLKDEINKLKQEAKEKDDKLLRSYADLQNYQKEQKKNRNIRKMKQRKNIFQN